MAMTIETIADWAHAVEVDDIPERVRELCRAQRRSVLAAVAASAGDAASRRVVAALERNAPDGDVPLVTSSRGVALDGALYAAAALSIALDFDDYLCFAHTGHSAVLVPILLAAETGATAPSQLVAQVVANEVEARLGGACLIGPLNGQLWSFVHAAGAALAAGRLLGLDRGALAHALAIALTNAPRPTVPGFMAPDSKLLTAAEPATAGLRAARLAAAGVTGPLDVLDHRDGFLAAFADAPLRGLLGRLGEGWATETLCIKPYPGCAYVDTVVDALVELGPPPASDVARVVVDAGLLTCGMDALSAAYASGGPPTPVTVNFSVPWNVAAALLGGRLTPHEVDATWLRDNHAALSALAARVELRHEWAFTRASAARFLPLLPPRRVVRDAGPRQLRRGLRRARHHHPQLIGFGDVRGIAKLRGLPAAARATSGRYWDPDALASFAMTFPAEVRVECSDGRALVARVDVPRGGAGHPAEGPVEVSRAKLEAWWPAIADAVDRDDDQLWKRLADLPPPNSLCFPVSSNEDHTENG